MYRLGRRLRPAEGGARNPILPIPQTAVSWSARSSPTSAAGFTSCGTTLPAFWRAPGGPVCVGASRFDLKMGMLRAASRGWCNGSTRQAKRSGRWDSNPRPTTWKAAALDQTELLPRRIGAAARTCDYRVSLSIRYRTSRLPRGFGDRMHARPRGLRARAFVPGSRWWSGSLASSGEQGRGRLTATTGGRPGSACPLGRTRARAQHELGSEIKARGRARLSAEQQHGHR